MYDPFQKYVERDKNKRYVKVDVHDVERFHDEKGFEFEKDGSKKVKIGTNYLMSIPMERHVDEHNKRLKEHEDREQALSEPHHPGDNPNLIGKATIERIVK